MSLAGDKIWASLIRRLRRLIIRERTAGEVALDMMLFVLGVAFFYVVDVTIIAHAAPAAFQDLLDLAVYLTRHTASSIQFMY